MKLYIKNMVATTCKMVVEAALEKIGLHYTAVELGYAEVTDEVTPEMHEQFRIALSKCGLELVNDRKSILVERIKKVLFEMVNRGEEIPKSTVSSYLCENIDYHYTYMANTFSEVTNITIEDYIIALKIERVKELLTHDDLTLTEISYRLQYSSVAHLSNQFKKTTGLTPKFFKNLQQVKRQNTLV